jgi:hypothetical protein
MNKAKSFIGPRRRLVQTRLNALISRKEQTGDIRRVLDPRDYLPKDVPIEAFKEIQWQIARVSNRCDSS